MLDKIGVHFVNAPQPVSMDGRTDESHHVDTANTMDGIRGIK